MQIDRPRVNAIATRWDECHSALTETARTVGDSSGDWAPTVRGAVTAFADSWGRDLAQLAAEAATTQQILDTAAANYAMTDEEAAERMRQVQKSVAPSR
ncbi:type VII secretion target [Williamsia maris]|uniref:Excreted virulence factor EspC, type VII ESX diderm n=1 Tax=Williamsia maris TaxID=72806 RepID=A0ABT1HBF5_9NOCA|nr:type VII secretion target [Williamsia maris]MCP2175494.1 Excreted virulence factor EspC, type VII ESX diderm [Williamsia maris]